MVATRHRTSNALRCESPRLGRGYARRARSRLRSHYAARRDDRAGAGERRDHRCSLGLATAVRNLSRSLRPRLRVIRPVCNVADSTTQSPVRVARNHRAPGRRCEVHFRDQHRDADFRVGKRLFAGASGAPGGCDVRNRGGIFLDSLGPRATIHRRREIENRASIFPRESCSKTPPPCRRSHSSRSPGQ